MIYFARLVTGNIKIGCTSNLVGRMKGFPQQRYGREVVCVLGVHDGGMEVEESIHRKFDHLRAKIRPRGRRPEDFRPDPELIGYILEHCRVTAEVMEANCAIVGECAKFRVAVLQDIRGYLDHLEGVAEKTAHIRFVPWESEEAPER